MASQADLGDHLDLDQSSVSDLVRRGVFPKAARGAYDLNACRVAYIRHLREQAAGRAGRVKTKLDIVYEGARLKKEMADKTAMENAVRRGDLIPRREVVEMIQKAFVSVRSKLLGLPSKEAAVLAAMDDARAIFDRLTSAIHELLTELANTRWVSKPERGDGGGGSSDRNDGGADPTAKADDKRVGRSKPKAKPRGKRRARSVGHKPG